MQKFSRRMVCGLATLGVAFAMVGCSGGSGGPIGLNALAGNYTGSFSGTTINGAPVRGTFNGTVNEQGQVTGTVTQGNQTFPATGTVESDGDITLTAMGFPGTPGAFTSTLTGELEREDGEIVGEGTFTTAQGGLNNAVTGRWTVIRAGTTPNPFAGTYNGSFTGTGSSTGLNGTFTAIADNNGSITGVVTQPGLGTYTATGVVSRSGDMLILAVGALPGNPPQQFVSLLEGTATRNNNVVTASGRFETSRDGQQSGAGTFTATRQ